MIMQFVCISFLYGRFHFLDVRKIPFLCTEDSITLLLHGIWNIPLSCESVDSIFGTRFSGLDFRDSI